MNSCALPVCCLVLLAHFAAGQTGKRQQTATVPGLPNLPGGVVNEISLAQTEMFLTTMEIKFKKISSNGYAFTYDGVDMLLINNLKDVQMSAGFNTSELIPLTAINQWNLQMRYTKAYLDPEGAAVIVSDLDLRGGVTLATVQEFVTTFFRSVKQFGEFLSTGGEEIPPGATIVQPAPVE